jgi:hypothetical protein
MTGSWSRDPAGWSVHCVVRRPSGARTGAWAAVPGTSLFVFRGLAAVASPAPGHGGPPSHEDLLFHDRVLAAVLREASAVPLDPGTVCHGGAVAGLLRSGYVAFRAGLAVAEQRVELTLRVTWSSAQAVARAAARSPEVRHLRAEAARAGGATYYARMRLAREISVALEEEESELVRGIYERLRPFAAGSRAFPATGARVILNALFQVERTRREEFEHALAALSARYAGLLAFHADSPGHARSFMRVRGCAEMVG